MSPVLGFFLRLKVHAKPEALERAEIVKVRSRLAPLVRAVSAAQQLGTVMMLMVTIKSRHDKSRSYSADDYSVEDAVRFPTTF